MIRLIFTLAILAFAAPALAGSEASFANGAVRIVEAKPARTITLTDNNGKFATIDFGGPEVTVTGNLPIGSAAKVFFDAVYQLHQDCR